MHSCRARRIASSLQGSVRLFTQLISKIRGVETHHLNALRAVASLVLNAAYKVMSLRDGNSNRSKTYTDEVEKALGKIGVPLKGWVKDKLSGADFGGSYIFYNQEGHVKQELRVCEHQSVGTSSCKSYYDLIFTVLEFSGTTELS